MVRSYVVRSAYVFFLLATWQNGVAFSQTPDDDDSLPPIETNEQLVGQVVAEDGAPVAARVFLLRSPEEGGYFTLPTKPLEYSISALSTLRLANLSTRTMCDLASASNHRLATCIPPVFPAH